MNKALADEMDVGSVVPIDIKEVFKTRDYANEKAITGTVKRVRMQSDTFSTGVLSVDSGPMLERECQYSAKGSIGFGDTVTLRGKWENGKYGWSFKATVIEYPMPEIESVDGLAEYLANDKAFAGIGPVKARLIAYHFKSELGISLATNPEEVQRVGNLTDVQIQTLCREWELRASINAISVWLADFGLTAYQVRRIAEQYGNSAQKVLSENPYKLADDLDGFGFLKSDAIALKLGLPKDSEFRIKTYIEYFLSERANSDGHTCIEYEKLQKEIVKNLYLDSVNSKLRVKECITQLVKFSRLDFVEYEEQYYLSLSNIKEQEEYIFDCLTQPRVEVFTPEELVESNKQIDELLEIASTGITFEYAQINAVRKALTYPVSVISGGAGTGKSFTIIRLLKALESAGKSYSICAPTGKAARRLCDDGIQASTIHRLLEYDPSIGGFYYDGNNKLPADFVIVDETSMCAIPLLHSLFQAIDFGKTSLLLVGDFNQLPPIGPGNTLRDIIKYELCPHTFLSVCHRSQGDLYKNAHNILSGRFNHKSTKREDGKWAWLTVEDRDDPEEVVELCKLLIDSQLEAWGYHPLMHAQIITPMNVRELGTNRLNLELQRVWQAKLGVDLPPVTKYDAKPKLLSGDKVMQTKNDYKEVEGGLMNGTTGIILDIVQDVNPEGKPCSMYRIQFDDRDTPVLLDATGKSASTLALAYACTIHKVQGSQYPCVIPIIHSLHSYMLNRNLLYTAVTRAQQSVLILGNSTGIRRAITRVDPQNRLTLTSLWANMPRKPYEPVQIKKAEEPAIVESENVEPVVGEIVCDEIGQPVIEPVWDNKIDYSYDPFEGLL